MQIYEANEYEQMVVLPPPFHIHDLLPKGGVLLLYGKTGVMKSWLCLHIAFCIATGQEWLGFPTTQARVLYVNFEISPATFHNRRFLPMKRRFVVEDQMLFLHSPGEMFLEEDDIFAPFEESVNAISPGVIILDCLSGFYGKSINDDEAISGLKRKMTLLRSNYERSLIIVHHDNKSPLAFGVDKASGSFKLAAWADTDIHMVTQPTCKQLQFDKVRHANAQIHSINIAFENILWRRV